MKYRLIFPVEDTHGTQSWLVDACDEEDAIKKHKAGESVFEYEEVEVLHLGEPEIEIAEKGGT